MNRALEKINFVNGQAPALSAENLNQLQTNIEEAIGENGGGLMTGAVVGYEGDEIPEGFEEVKKGYSTEETLTGEIWIDEKPIYRKVINFGNLPNGTTKSVEHGISNLGNVINVYCVANNADYSSYIPIPYVTESDGYANYARQIGLNMTNTIVTITSSMVDRSSYSAYVTIEYTKTTD